MGSVHAKSVDPLDADDVPSAKLDLQGLKTEVQRVQVSGLGRTKDDIVVKSIRNIFHAKDFQSVVFKIHEARNKLEKLGCFQGVGVLIDTYNGPDAHHDGIEVIFVVEEKKLLGAKVNTSLGGQNEGEFSTNGLLKNVFGRGEEFNIQLLYGNKNKAGFSSNFIKPFHDDFDTRLTQSIYQCQSEMGWSGYKELDRGALLKLAFTTSPSVTQQLVLESAWRQLSCLSKSTAFAVREHSGHTLKNSLKYQFIYDDRDNTIFPSDGTLLKTDCEFAGIGGNVGFIKNEANIQQSLPLFYDVVACTSLSAGLLVPLKSGKNYTISDRFILGGPTSFRGFEMGGVGPHSEGYALGATSYWRAGIQLFSPLPLLPINSFTDRFRLSLWINLGNIGDWTNEQNRAALRRLLLNDTRLTYGLGLALNLANMARVELNYCVPLHYSKGDRIHQGIQFGISADVL